MEFIWRTGFDSSQRFYNLQKNFTEAKVDLNQHQASALPYI